MEIIGTIIILLILAGSYVFFIHKKRKATLELEQKKQLWYEQLDRQMSEHLHKRYVAVVAGGDGNSEINVSDAIKAVSMPECKRIRYE